MKQPNTLDILYKIKDSLEEELQRKEELKEYCNYEEDSKGDRNVFNIIIGRIETLMFSISLINEQIRKVQETEPEIEVTNMMHFAGVLSDYINRKPDRKDKIISIKGKSLLFSDLPNEVLEGTEIGYDFYNASLKMSIEELSLK